MPIKDSESPPSTELSPPTNAVAAPRDVSAYFLRLGALGFGGPIALVGYMQRDLVEERKWFTKEEFSEGLALAQLAPGPLAAQLAIYLGWLRGGVLSATAVGIAFVLPSFLMVMAVSWAYMRYGGLPWMAGAFYGVGAAVIAIIGRSAFKLLRSTLGKDRLLWAVFLVLAVATAVTGREDPLLILLGGTLYMLFKAPPKRGARTGLTPSLLPAWLLTGLSGAASPALLTQVFLYFAAAGAFVFGSGLAIVPFLHGGVVDEFKWLNERQFLDAVAVAMITPGPVVITVAFIGYLVAGPAGAVLAALGVFLPCYLFVVIPAKYFKKATMNASVNAFVAGVTAAATGAIAGAVVVLGTKAIVDVPTALIAASALAALVYGGKKVPEPALIAVAAIVGIVLQSVL